MDISWCGADTWIIDFGWEMSEEEAPLSEAPFQHVHENVKPVRKHTNRDLHRRNGWRQAEPRPGMWAALANRARHIATPAVSKYRLFEWLEKSVCPDHQLIVIACDADCTSGTAFFRCRGRFGFAPGSGLATIRATLQVPLLRHFRFPTG